MQEDNKVQLYIGSSYIYIQCMDRRLFDSLSMTHQFFLSLLFVLCSIPPQQCRAAAAAQELLIGFKAAPDPSVLSFQSLLGDSNSNYSLGFLRVGGTHLALSVVHVPSSESMWTANVTRLAKWSDETELFFNGSLVLSDRSSGVIWSTHTDGDRVWLSNTSNLQIQRLDGGGGLAVDSVLWQSFDFPANTLVENQNFTSAMVLVSSNGLYSMRLGFDFIGLYTAFHNGPGSGLLYWKHRALQAKAKILKGHGPVYATLTSSGYLGMYQNGSVPVDVDPFNSYQLPVPGARRLRMEDDGNLYGYFWTGSNWVPDYQAIPDPCELPNACGSYGLCHPGGKGCSCLDNSSAHASSGTCISPENQYSGELCRDIKKNYKVVRRNGVELPFKELRDGHRKTESFAECESACEANCACRGAVYSNTSGLCYTLDYPFMTLVGVADETKMGYFKVREVELGRERKVMVEEWAGFGMVCGAIFVICGVGGWWYRSGPSGMGKSGYRDEEEEEDSVIGGVGPYKHLGAESFRSIELSQS